MEDKEFDYMNVIPLVDIMLVLLTIVLITSTFIAAGALPVELPKATENHLETLKTQTIEINKAGDIYLNSRLMPLCNLGESITTFDKETPILIRADKDIVLQAFVDVLDVVKNKGFKKVSLMTEENA
jgi:biopolymer transport protein ExbD